uniref:Mucin-1 n=1 Tax=Sciurus vulgaris TaxID=55149 RepID=A0A8D2DDC0_SCIVU
MTPGMQSPFFLLLLLPVLTVLKTFPVRAEKTLNAQSNPVSNPVEKSTIYKQDGFLGFSSIIFRPGSVVVELTLVFREGTTNAKEVMSQFVQHKEEGSNYNLNISGIKVNEVLFPSPAQSGSGVPGWGIALLVLVCVLLALAILYLIALAVCQCRQKNYGHLDIFPSRETYHPMSEYPTYHTHGRYVPPGSTNRSPYEEVSAGNGGGSLSYTNPAVTATSANL